MQDLLMICISLGIGGIFLWTYTALYRSLKRDLRDQGKDPDQEDGWY